VNLNPDLDFDKEYVLKQVQFVAIAFMLVGFLGPIIQNGENQAIGDLLAFIGVALGVPATILRIKISRNKS